MCIFFLASNSHILYIFGGVNDFSLFSGTYIYTEKSGADFDFQQLSYSGQKKRNLVKPLLVVATDGHIIDIIGPYTGRCNDASILQHALEKKEDKEKLLDFLNGNACVVADRGFLDVVKCLEELNISIVMPKFLNKNQKQFTAQDANYTRLVTKIRWVVESANARFKKWKYFRNVVQNKSLYFLREDLLFVCAMINCFRPPLRQTSLDCDEQCATKMKERLNVENDLVKDCATGGVFCATQHKSKWLQVDEVDNFPRLSPQKMEQITFGVYQAKQAQLYFKNCSKLQFYKHHEQNDFIYASVRSWHKKNSKYNVYIKFNENSNEDTDVFESIKSWYCSCSSGSRTLGMCSHCTTVIYALGLNPQKKTSRKIIFDDVPQKRKSKTSKDNAVEADSEDSDPDSDPDSVSGAEDTTSHAFDDGEDVHDNALFTDGHESDSESNFEDWDGDGDGGGDRDGDNGNGNGDEDENGDGNVGMGGDTSVSILRYNTRYRRSNNKLQEWCATLATDPSTSPSSASEYTVSPDKKRRKK
jgi:hypothetical protein